MSRRALVILLCLLGVVGCDDYDQQNATAVASGDHGEIRRAFHAATYNRRKNLDSTRNSHRAHLEHKDPVVRLYAAEYLYVLGDSSGYPVLIDLVEMPTAVDAHGKDSRLRAIDLLKKYRERRAIPEIERFFSRTKSIDAFDALLHLAGERAPVDPLTAYPDARPYPSTTVFSLSLKGPQAASELAAATFQDPKCPEIYAERSRQIAAWAMLRGGADEPYFSFMSDQAEKAIAGDRPPLGADTNQYRKAFEYLASVTDSRAKEVLVRALESSDDRVVQVAIVNLIFNHKALPEARQRLITELEQRTKNLGSEFTLQIVAALDDPELKSAAQEFSKMDSSGGWHLWSVARKGWPIYNWIDDYVVILNDESEQSGRAFPDRNFKP